MALYLKLGYFLIIITSRRGEEVTGREGEERKDDGREKEREEERKGNGRPSKARLQMSI